MQPLFLKTRAYLRPKPLRHVPKAARLSPGSVGAALAPGKEEDSLPILPKISPQHQLQLISNRVKEKLRKIVNTHKRISQVS